MLETTFGGTVGWLTARMKGPQSDGDSEAETVEILAPQPGERFLVIGLGAGVGIATLAEACPNCAIVGVDPSAGVIRAAATRNKALIDGGRLRLETTTLDGLANRGGSYDGWFDGAIAVHSFQTCLPLEAAAASLSRLLRPGGRFVTLTHGPTIDRRFGSVKKFMEKAGPAFTQAGFDKLRGGRGRAEKCRVVVFRGRKAEA
jgi:SAM-dependent methyltransferase